MKLLDTLLNWFSMVSPWELVAVVLAVAYVILAMKKRLACWPVALASSCIYVALMIESRLYMEAALNVFYAAMAVYGYFSWRHRRDTAGAVTVEHWSIKAHLMTLAIIAVLTGINGVLLSSHTDAARPYLDSLITWSSVVTTWMVARRVVENWLYWVVIDAVAALLYFQQSRSPTGILFLFYVAISLRGYQVWMRESARSCSLSARNLKLPTL